ncbi:MAG: hypothetical protein ACYDAJ_10910 [Nitrosotalea sp.]
MDGKTPAQACGIEIKGQYRQDRKPTFNNFERSKVNGQWKIFLHSPTKIMRKCSIEFNGKKLLVDDGKNYFKSIGAGGGGNFYLPKDISDDDDHFVIVKDGRKTILKERFNDMYTVNG